jgi:diguanylate cyclase (GGDEF)-like protein
VLFHDRLRAAMQRGVRQDNNFALVLIDIDGFKGVNDTYGHLAGDALLQAISARLSDHVRTNDTVARLGGDEFALIFEDVGDVSPLLQRCQLICDVLAQPYPLGSSCDIFTAHVSASLGIALWQENIDSDETLIQRADRALYQAKENGGNGCALSQS